VQSDEQYDAREKNAEGSQKMTVGEDAFHRLKKGHGSPQGWIAVKHSPYVWGRWRVNGVLGSLDGKLAKFQVLPSRIALAA
jgi:hypothetical protein